MLLTNQQSIFDTKFWLGVQDSYSRKWKPRLLLECCTLLFQHNAWWWMYFPAEVASRRNQSSYDFGETLPAEFHL